MSETECTGCEFLGDDGCGPGTVMLCLHSVFGGKHGYENAIVQWRYNDRRRVVSDVCPKHNPNTIYPGPRIL